ncbi:MAG: hypothetical protein IK152_03675 [Lachnospiraceae bacterium]|nr:hypothetical protein [Lachnospiraceae bacterium]
MIHGIRKRLLACLISVSLILAFTGPGYSEVEASQGRADVAASSSGVYLGPIKGPGPIWFNNGMAQPVIRVSNAKAENYTNEGNTIQRFVVYVETDYDTDFDGKADLVKALVQVPKQAVDGDYKAPVIYEASPYLSGLDLKRYPHVKENVIDEATLYSNPVEKRTPVGIATTAEQAATADSGDWNYTFDIDPSKESFMWGVDGYNDFLCFGYAVVLCSGLGTYGSEGFECCGTTLERDAFKSVVEWIHGDRTAYTDKEHNIAIKADDWSNGKTGMAGISYSAAMAYEVADTGVEGLEVISIGDGPFSWYDYANSQGFLRNGLEFGYTRWLSSFCASRFYQDYDPEQLDKYLRYSGYVTQEANKSRGNYSDFWATRDFHSTPTNCKAAVILTQGLNDENVVSKQWDLARTRLKKAGCKVMEILHQGKHHEPMAANDGGYEFYEEYGFEEILNVWFSHYLFGLDNQTDDMPDMLWQSNITGEYQEINDYDTGDTVKIIPGRNDKETLNAEDTFLTNKEIYANTLIGAKTTSAIYWSYDIKEPITINGKIPVHLRVKTDFPEGYDLPISVYLVDQCDTTFRAFSPEWNSQVDFESSAFAAGYYDISKDRKVTNKKMVTVGIMSLLNPGADYEPTTAIAPTEPVKSGEYYDYTLYLYPTYYTFEAGHRLELYITTFGDTGSELEESSIGDYAKLTYDYSITVDNGASYCMLPVTEGSAPKMELNDDKLVVRTKKTSKAIKATLQNDSISRVSINKPEVAKVSFSGDTIIVKAGKKKGKAVVTVTSLNGIVRKFKLETQTGKVTTKKITGIPKKLTLKGSGRTKTYRVTAVPDKISTGETIKVKSNRKKVAKATFDQATGIVTIKSGKKGTALIYVSAGKKKAYIRVIVK